mmetsp:Transcript_29213/g.40355  ORF Transcript_29213/g.40355 Transcript_29213/m.40355 type:complete len:249 (+) Transcript_29213:159-905(+)|eukprot:CAMPEP_0196573270 /NCGR_PEP_ID=MMETSP1081-20130531/3197_1 /TAXON_ID=36882 /ORGANISM="Pyramimonas amylifera, Strain CCMP720" /LENGTH=248 /DNA_ID=CAMNT_0041890921 /DNA_START=159 /DNA_END=905 /DNA_ORIENTATION=-
MQFDPHYDSMPTTPHYSPMSAQPNEFGTLAMNPNESSPNSKEQKEAVNSAPSEEILVIECTKCAKWRLCPKALYKEEGVSMDWQCRDNHWHLHLASCSVEMDLDEGTLRDIREQLNDEDACMEEPPNELFPSLGESTEREVQGQNKMAKANVLDEDPLLAISLPVKLEVYQSAQLILSKLSCGECSLTLSKEEMAIVALMMACLHHNVDTTKRSMLCNYANMKSFKLCKLLLACVELEKNVNIYETTF